MTRPSQKSKRTFRVWFRGEQQYHHTGVKVKERFGLHLSREQYEKMIADIKAKKVQFLREEKDGKTVWLVKLSEEQSGFAVYDPMTKSIATILKTDMKY